MANIYPITAMWTDGDWGNVTEPHVYEFRPMTRDRKAQINITRPLRFDRVILLDQTGQLRKWLGLNMGVEAQESADRYLHIVKGHTYSDAMDIFNQMREIAAAKAIADTATYRSYVFEEIEPTRNRGHFQHAFDLVAYKAVTEREVPA